MNAQPVSRAALVWMALARFLAGLVLIGALLFLPAGTLRFWQAWVYVGLVFIPLAIVGCILLARDPDLLERRTRMRETHAQQKVAIAAMSLLLLAVYRDLPASTSGLAGRRSRSTWSWRQMRSSC